MKYTPVRLSLGALALLWPAMADSKLPKAVEDSLRTRFPGATIDKVSKEKEKGAVVYDIEFRQEGQKFEADFLASGALQNWERETPLAGLPAAVRDAAANRYPQAVIQSAMAVTAVANGKETLEGYELSLKTSGRKAIEMTVAPDGKIIEDSGARK